MTEIKQLNASQEEIDAWTAFSDVDTIPAGFRPFEEWSVIWNRGHSQIREKLRVLTEKGHMKRQVFMAKDVRGFVQKKPYWKLVKK